MTAPSDQSQSPQGDPQFPAQRPRRREGGRSDQRTSHTVLRVRFVCYPDRIPVVEEDLSDALLNLASSGLFCHRWSGLPNDSRSAASGRITTCAAARRLQRPVRPPLRRWRKNRSRGCCGEASLYGDGAGHWESVFAQATHVDLDGALDSPKRRVDSLARRNTSRKIRHRRAPVAAWVAVDPNEILSSPHDVVPFRPACRFTDANVPFGISSPSAPLTVTRPGFVACLN